MRAKINQFFADINFTYDDLPYLYLPLIAATAILLVCWYFWGHSTILWGSFVLSTYLILATQFHLYRSTQKDLENHQQKIQSYFSLFSLIDFKRSLPFMTGWAATPELALITAEEIIQNKPEHIVELGSGISTIIASYCLQKNGSGTITSLDHNKIYGKKTKRQIQNHGLTEITDIQYAPLVSHKINDSTWHWYDLDKIILPDSIDMLLVDGPPVETNKEARYPSVPLLFDRLCNGAVIILHDTHRLSEQRILEKWKQKYPTLSCEVMDTEKGVAILRK